MSTSSQADARPPSQVASLAVVGICLFLGGISAVEARHVSVTHGFPLAWSLVLAATTPRWILLAVVLPFVLRLSMRMRLVPRRGPVIAMHLGVFLALSASHAIVDAWTLGFGSPFVVAAFSWLARVMRSWYSAMPTILSMYVAVLVAAWGMEEARERQRRTLRASILEAQLQSARLASLRAQLQPHFLYNTLNAIAALVSDVQPARAVAAIEQLGELLHASLREDGRDEITVEEEVALASRYLALQGMRFGDRLSVAWHVSPRAAGYLVPVLLLQPIVENAVVHGMDSGQETLHISIGAVETSQGLELRVENDGSSLDPDGSRPPPGHGVGLAATRARLATAYGERATLSLLPRAGGGVIVRILLPRSTRSNATLVQREAFALAEAT